MKIKNFPKSEKKLQEFLRRNLEAFQKNVMKDSPTEILAPPDIQEEWVVKYSEVVLTTEPRTVVDFLDEQGIYITTDYIYQEGFVCHVVGANWIGRVYENRIEAELEAFEAAFELLEEKLK